MSRDDKNWSDISNGPKVKRIVLLSDGTGNAASKVWHTNVWRIYESLDLASGEQVARYDDGVGTSSVKFLAALGGIFGWGLKRNVIDLYKFLCRNYHPDIKIYAFGFSRGAFTIRLLIGLILDQGLAPYRSEGDLHARARDAYRAFRAEHSHTTIRIETPFRMLRDVVIRFMTFLAHRAPYDKAHNRQVSSVEFIGLWDTVAAYGLPIEEMARGVGQWLWPMELPSFVLEYPRVKRACHALALDDERTTFHPILWSEKDEAPPVPDYEGRYWLKNERISQVWFPGVHSNVGGGYPDDALARISLHWIMEEAKLRGLEFKVPPGNAPDGQNISGRLYDSRSGLKSYYRYGPRNVAELCKARFNVYWWDRINIRRPKIHESVLRRMRTDGNAYAPIAIPANYAVAMYDGRILWGSDNPFEDPDRASTRAWQQEKVWNLVWIRRLVYFMTLAATLHLALFWLFHDLDTEHESTTLIRPVSELIRLLQHVLPEMGAPFQYFGGGITHFWTDWYAGNPEWFLVGVIVLAMLIWTGPRLGVQISDLMHNVWKDQAIQSHSALHALIFALRTNRVLQAILASGKHFLLPFVFAIFLTWVGFGAASHLLFNFLDSAGVFCHESERYNWVYLPRAGDHSKPLSFATNCLCFPTGVIMERNARYSVTITVSSPWANGAVSADPIGFVTSSVPTWEHRVSMHFIALQRRVFFRRWFTLLGRVGATGNAEIYLRPDYRGQNDSGQNVYRALIGPMERSGEFFLYVNDAVLPFPWIKDFFYRDNGGTATVVITRL